MSHRGGGIAETAPLLRESGRGGLAAAHLIITM